MRDTSLADVIRRNTETNNLQENVFFFRASISGHVAVMSPPTGGAENVAVGGEAPQGPRQPVANVPVQLVDAAGVVVATTRTHADGSYLFNHLDLGTYHVEVLLPRGLTLVHSTMHDIAITRGMNVPSVDFDVAPLPPMIVPTPPTAPSLDQTNPPRIAQQPPIGQNPMSPPLGAQPPAMPPMMDRPRVSATVAQRHATAREVSARHRGTAPGEYRGMTGFARAVPRCIAPASHKTAGEIESVSLMLDRVTHGK